MTVSAYTVGENLWRLVPVGAGEALTAPLRLSWEVDGSSLSGDYLPPGFTEPPALPGWETPRLSAAELLQLWSDGFGLGAGIEQAPIIWSVESFTVGTLYDVGFSEFAPYQPKPGLFGSLDLLDYFKHPVQAETGEPLNFLRLPVRNLAWSERWADTGGFVQEATSWLPSPLQPTAPVAALLAAAGL